MMVVHCTHDDVVPLTHAHTLFRNAGTDPDRRELYFVQGGHNWTNPDSVRRMLEHVQEFVSQVGV